ncbi:hypothetical protein T09_13707 [Trichinella sp. T9]|nr:hypothetical protein T09_13707 [Trichinella sp. T9]
MYEVVKESSTFNAAVERVGYVFYKSINSSSAFVDMPVATTSL